MATANSRIVSNKRITIVSNDRVGIIGSRVSTAVEVS